MYTEVIAITIQNNLHLMYLWLLLSRYHKLKEFEGNLIVLCDNKWFVYQVLLSYVAIELIPTDKVKCLDRCHAVHIVCYAVI